QRRGKRAFPPVWPETHINSIRRSFTGGLADQPQQPFAQLDEIFPVTDLAARAARRRHAIGRKKKDQIDVRSVIELARTKFAKRHDTEFRARHAAFAVAELRRA